MSRTLDGNVLAGPLTGDEELAGIQGDVDVTIPMSAIIALLSGPIMDATSLVKGKIKLAGDLAGTADAPTVPGLALKANANAVVPLAGDATKTGVLTFASAPVVPDASWTIGKTAGLQLALNSMALDSEVVKLTGNQTIVGTTSLRAATLGAAQLNLLDSTGGVVGQIRAYAGANVGIGSNALDALTGGTFNVGIGTDALGSLTAGFLNTAIGLNALAAATLGFHNTAIGVNALQNSTGDPGVLPGTTGSNNTAIGANAAQQLTSGHRNTAIGVDALFVETTGDYNVGIGVHALNSQVGVDGSVAIGYTALFSTVSGLNNTAIGNQALNLATTSNNAAVGAYALAYATSGSNNTAIGALAASFPNGIFANATTTGSGQTVIGSQAGQSGTSAVINGTAIGYLALFGGNGAIAIGAGAQALHNDSAAIGSSAVTTAAFQVMVGPRDVEITSPTKGLVGKSADGTRWRATFDNTGALVTTAI